MASSSGFWLSEPPQFLVATSGLRRAADLGEQAFRLRKERDRVLPPVLSLRHLAAVEQHGRFLVPIADLPRNPEGLVEVPFCFGPSVLRGEQVRGVQLRGAEP